MAAAVCSAAADCVGDLLIGTGSHEDTSKLCSEGAWLLAIEGGVHCGAGAVVSGVSHECVAIVEAVVQAGAMVILFCPIVCCLWAGACPGRKGGGVGHLW